MTRDELRRLAHHCETAAEAWSKSDERGEADADKALVWLQCAELAHRLADRAANRAAIEETEAAVRTGAAAATDPQEWNARMAGKVEGHENTGA